MAHLDHTPEVPEQPDEWHAHTREEGPPQEEHAGSINTALLAFAFVGTVVSIVVITAMTYLYFTAHTNQLRRTRVETTALAADYVKYRADQDHALHEYSWIDEERTVVSLPLSVAMERVLERYAETQGEQSMQEGDGR